MTGSTHPTLLCVLLLAACGGGGGSPGVCLGSPEVCGQPAPVGPPPLLPPIPVAPQPVPVLVPVPVPIPPMTVPVPQFTFTEPPPEPAPEPTLHCLTILPVDMMAPPPNAIQPCLLTAK